MSDDELLTKALAGDREALGRLLERDGPAVRARLAGMIPQRWRSLLTVDDLLQETYTEAFRNISRFVAQGPESFTAWLISLARCNLQDALRMLEADKRGGGLKPLEIGEGSDSRQNLLEQVGHRDTPSHEAARGEALAALERAVQSLPDVYQEAVRRYDLNGESIDDVATDLGRSPGAVHMLRSRAHKMLAALMGRPSDFLSHGA